MYETSVLYPMVEELLAPDDRQTFWLEVEFISLLEKTEILRKMSMLDSIVTLSQRLDKRVKQIRLGFAGGSTRAMPVHLQRRQMPAS